MLRFLLWLMLRLRRRQFIYNLSRVEYAVALFCYSTAQRAVMMPTVSSELIHHGKEEVSHANRLADLIDGVRYPSPNQNWNREHPEWRDYDGFTPGMVIPQLSSLAIGRIFFCGHEPQRYRLDEVLAFMSILEERAHRFYAALAAVADPALAEVAQELARDEVNHARLCGSASNRIGQPPMTYHDCVAPDLIRRWRFRAAIAELFAPLAVWFLIR